MSGAAKGVGVMASGGARQAVVAVWRGVRSPVVLLLGVMLVAGSCGFAQRGADPATVDAAADTAAEALEEAEAAVRLASTTADNQEVLAVAERALAVADHALDAVKGAASAAETADAALAAAQAAQADASAALADAKAAAAAAALAQATAESNREAVERAEAAAALARATAESNRAAVERAEAAAALAQATAEGNRAAMAEAEAALADAQAAADQARSIAAAAAAQPDVTRSGAELALEALYGARLLSLGNSVEASISRPGEADNFLFEVTESRGESAVVVLTEGATDTYLELYRVNLASPGLETDRLLVGNDDSGTGGNASLEVLLESGWYRVVVTHYSPVGSGDYTLRLF